MGLLLKPSITNPLLKLIFSPNKTKLPAFTIINTFIIDFINNSKDKNSDKKPWSFIFIIDVISNSKNNDNNNNNENGNVF